MINKYMVYAFFAILILAIYAYFDSAGIGRYAPVATDHDFAVFDSKTGDIYGYDKERKVYFKNNFKSNYEKQTKK